MNRSSRAGALHEVHMQHLDEGTIHAWLDGALPADEAESVAKHVDECRECAANVAEARGMIVAAGNIVSALDHVRGGVIPAPSMPAASQHSIWRRLRFTPARAALAATLLVAVASLLTVRFASEPDVARFERSQSAPAAAPTVVASQAPAGAPVQDSIMVAKKAAPLRVPASTAATAQAQAAARDSTRAMNAMVTRLGRGASNRALFTESPSTRRSVARPVNFDTTSGAAVANRGFTCAVIRTPPAGGVTGTSTNVDAPAARFATYWAATIRSPARNNTGPLAVLVPRFCTRARIVVRSFCVTRSRSDTANTALR